MPASGVTDVTVYDMIGLPPFDVGAVKETVAFSFPHLRQFHSWSTGTTPGFTAADTADAGPVPRNVSRRYLEGVGCAVCQSDYCQRTRRSSCV